MSSVVERDHDHGEEDGDGDGNGFAKGGVELGEEEEREGSVKRRWEAV